MTQLSNRLEHVDSTEHLGYNQPMSEPFTPIPEVAIASLPGRNLVALWNQEQSLPRSGIIANAYLTEGSNGRITIYDYNNMVNSSLKTTEFGTFFDHDFNNDKGHILEFVVQPPNMRLGFYSDPHDRTGTLYLPAKFRDIDKIELPKSKREVIINKKARVIGNLGGYGQFGNAIYPTIGDEAPTRTISSYFGSYHVRDLAKWIQQVETEMMRVPAEDARITVEESFQRLFRLRQLLNR